MPSRCDCWAHRALEPKPRRRRANATAAPAPAPLLDEVPDEPTDEDEDS